MTETQNIKSKRDQFGERLRQKYPDKQYADDEALFSQINDDYDEYDKQLGGYKEREGKLVDLFTKDPRSAQFITDMAHGKSPISNFISLIGIDGLKEMLEDPEKIEEFNEKNQEYLERLAKSKELDEQWDQNMAQTLQMLEQKKSELGLSDEQIDAAAEWIKQVTNDAVTGCIRPETFDMAMKAINHDADVDAASKEGEVRGRNAKVESALRKPSRGDGTAQLAGSNNTPSAQTSSSIFDIASGA